MPEKNRAMYKGDGKLFLNGVPARHLTEDDWSTLTTEQKDEVRASKLYDVRTNAEMSATSSPASSPKASPSGTEAKPADASA